jgi:hypothetical protein
VVLGADGPIEPTEDDWTLWVELARTERVLPLLHHVVSSSGSDTAPALHEEADRFQLDVMATLVRFEHDLLGIAEVLSSGEVVFAVLKGVATAHLDYPDPALRQFADVDLLVAPKDLDRACTLLGTLGWIQAYALPRYHERFTHAVTLRSDRKVEVDLHQRLAHRALGELLPTRDLLANAVQFELAGRTLSALSKSDRLIHAAIHTQTSRPPYRRLSSSADVLVLTDQLADEAGLVLARAEAWRVRPLVEAAIRSAYDEASWPVPPPWVAAMSAPMHRRNRLVERAYLSERRRPLTEELAYLGLMHGWRDRAAYVRGFFFTDPDYSAQNERSGLVAQTRYLWSRLRSGPSS